MDQAPRYAIYFVPAAESELYRFGSAVLGYDCYTGGRLPRPANLNDDHAEWERLTDEPRRYGFHATLKAPFRLSPSCTEERLVRAVRNFATLGHAVCSFVPTIGMLGGFAAVVPAQVVPALNGLANSCTAIFDGFRAPMTPQERARRVAAGLSQSQVKNLDRWGYPYLFADFQFHMTLTGRIEPARRKAALATLCEIFRRMRGESPVRVDRLALVKQESPRAAFRVLEQAVLSLGDPA